MKVLHANLLILALASATMAPAQAAETFWGLGKAKDGDSLLVGSREVRLFGVDAPEFDQFCQRAGAAWACGSEAANKLSELVTGKEVHCQAIATDQYARTLAKCSVGAVDVNRAMVAAGFAVAYRRYSSEYVTAEGSAKVNHRGLWGGQFELPESYRAEGVTTATPAKTSRSTSERSISRSRTRSSDWAGRARANCNIKGNQNRRGQWIYHLPGMPYYDQTRPEQIFCSEAEAQAAGYRRAIVRP